MGGDAGRHATPWLCNREARVPAQGMASSVAATLRVPREPTLDGASRSHWRSERGAGKLRFRREVVPAEKVWNSSLCPPSFREVGPRPSPPLSRLALPRASSTLLRSPEPRADLDVAEPRIQPTHLLTVLPQFTNAVPRCITAKQLDTLFRFTSLLGLHFVFLAFLVFLASAPVALAQPVNPAILKEIRVRSGVLTEQSMAVAAAEYLCTFESLISPDLRDLLYQGFLMCSGLPFLATPR